MAYRWNKSIQLEPWRILRLEVRSMPTPKYTDKKQQENERLKATLREEIKAEGGRRISKSTISIDPRDLPEILNAFQEAVDKLPDDTFDLEMPTLPDAATWSRLHRRLTDIQRRDGGTIQAPPLTPPFPNEFWPEYVKWAQEQGLLRALEAFLSRN
jgi:hypothetical protein